MLGSCDTGSRSHSALIFGRGSVDRRGDGVMHGQLLPWLLPTGTRRHQRYFVVCRTSGAGFRKPAVRKRFRLNLASSGGPCNTTLTPLGSTQSTAQLVATPSASARACFAHAQLRRPTRSPACSLWALGKALSLHQYPLADLMQNQVAQNLTQNSDGSIHMVLLLLQMILQQLVTSLLPRQHQH